jgi:hypothetical protein
MFLAVITAVIGALGGALLAWRRKGSTADILQYAAVFALIFALAGLFLSILIVRLAA